MRCDLKRTPLRCYDRCVHDLCDGPCVQGRGHGDQQQVIAQRPCHFEAEGKAKVSVQAAFVEFVKDNRANVWQVWLIL